MTELRLTGLLNGEIEMDYKTIKELAGNYLVRYAAGGVAEKD